MPKTFKMQAYRPKPRYVPKVKKHEQSIQRRFCSYVRKHYPELDFHSDFAAGLKLTINQAVVNKSIQSGRGWPDWFCPEPKVHKLKDGSIKEYHGIALELKREGTPIIIKIGPRKGHLSRNPHIQEQAAVLKRWNSKGYYANFAIGLDDAIRQLDWYMGKPQNESMF